MRNQRILCTCAALVFGGGISSFGVAGCFDVRDCDFYPSHTCPTPPPPPPPPPPMVCDPGDGAAVSEACGIFVQAGKNGDGSLGNPTGSLSDAIAKASGGRVYVCASSMPIQEVVEITGPVTISGGFDCDGWVYHAQMYSAVSGMPGHPGLKISGGGGTLVTLKNIAVESTTATDPGASSYGVWVDGATVQMTNVTVLAGPGADGLAGVPPAPIGPAAASGDQGTVCGATNVAAGANGGIAACVGAAGYDGGLGGASNGGVGDDGFAGKGLLGGLKGFGSGSAGSCQPGGTGGPGMPGNSGVAATTSTGTFALNRYQPVGGSPGQPGTSGSGGGGGGAAGCPGPSGSGGGAGGCGGAAGDAGRGGGGSFALISINAAISLSNVALTAGTGGQGGNGAEGQAGQPGGKGGGTGACNGGKGGDGGSGGAGAGGAGGPSVGIAVVGGSAPSQPNGDVTIKVAPAAAGGAGGDMGVASEVGAKGLSMATEMFTSS